MTKRVLLMAEMNFKTFSVQGATQLMDAVRGLFAKPDAELEHLIPIQRHHTEAVVERSERVDQIRYEQMLERELDRQLMSEVEREDSDTLARVREALYAED